MSGKRTYIGGALDAGLLSFMTSTSVTLTTHIAWPNEQFDPMGATWFRPTVMPGEPSQLTVGGTNYGENRHVGVYQVSCFYPKSEGETDALSMADAIASYFKRGQTFTCMGVTVRVLHSWVMQSQEEPAWLHVPVTVRYFADVDNT